jgi:protein SCO1/2
MKLKRLILWLVSSLIIAAMCILLIYYQLEKQATVSVQDRSVQGLPNIGGDFVLTDQHGVVRSTTDFHGKFQLIYFGYSFCPDICPLGLQNISGALTKLGRDLDQVVPIFVTVDPERDTVDSLKIYTTNFHPNFIMFTGTPDEIAMVQKKYKVYAAKAKPDGTMSDYLMDHSTLIYLLDRRGRFIKSFAHTSPPEELAAAMNVALADEKKQN